MRGLLRRLASGSLLLVLGLGIAERSALHGHPLDENDLVPHAIALVKRGPACGPAAHFDAGRLGSHPVCLECVLAASPSTVSPLAPVPSELRTVALLFARAVADAPVGRAAHAAGARAPPAA